MSPSRKKLAKPKEVSLETPPKDELPKGTIPKDEYKHFDEDDGLVASTIPDFSVASEEQKEISPPTICHHAINTLFKLSSAHPDGTSLKKWVHYKYKDSMEQFFQWDEWQLAVGELLTSYLDSQWDKTSLEYLKTNRKSCMTHFQRLLVRCFENALTIDLLFF